MSNKVVIKIGLITINITILFILIIPVNGYADEGVVFIDGKEYEFTEDCKYVVEEAESTISIQKGENTYGVFSISGNIVDSNTIEGISLYGVDGGSIDFLYTYSDDKLSEKDDEWYLVSDDCKEVNGISVEDKVQAGTIIIQTSKDGTKWVDTFSDTNVFEDNPIQTGAFYSSTDVQLKNGCYYKVLVTYELCKKDSPTKILFWSKDSFKYKRIIEEYCFYAYDVNEAITEGNEENGLKYSFSNRINTGLDNGYSEEHEIDKDDVHFGWNLGEFFVRGFTRQTEDKEGTPVFLKTPGDDVVLYFNLQQDIDALNGDDSLYISTDDKGYDKYFEMPQTYMGRGTLIIRYTDYENVVHDPIIYTDFLSAEISPGADTRVQLCEEGDYEVSLDYEIAQKDKYIFLNGYTNYKIFFKFSIRNGKCVVYPIDTVTGADLSNSSYTENGFTLDLAYSRYLELSVTHEILDENEELCKDFVRTDVAKNGSTFTDEGLYTINAYNKYTDQSVTKVISVGSNDLLKACAKTEMSFSQVKELVNRGAVIDKYGDIDVSKIDLETSKDDMSPNNQGGYRGIITILVCYLILEFIAIIALAIVIVIVSRSRSRYKAYARKLEEQKMGK